MVEMALVLPILLVLALGVVDFGRAMNYWNDVNQIAADGARFAAVNRNPGADAVPQLDFREWLRRQAVTGELRDGVLAGGTAADCAQDPPPNPKACSSSVTTQLKVCIESGANPAQPLTIGHPIRVRVESSYNLIPFHLLPGIDQEEQLGSVLIKGDAVMRLEQNYTGPAGCFPA